MQSDTTNTAADLRRAVDHAFDRLSAVPDERAAVRPSPGKWSAKEVIGHLIDSACNNHGRFVRAQLQDDLIFAGYEQDRWITAQRYQDAQWRSLLELWRAYNHHIAWVIETCPDHERTRLRGRHNLHQIAWSTVAESQPTTLGYFMRDYVAHLNHHVAQALERTGLV
jgi:hypothetical protein